MPWSDWERCSKTCGGGFSVRSRVCTEQYLGSSEDENGCEEAESMKCNVDPCGVEVLGNKCDKFTS